MSQFGNLERKIATYMDGFPLIRKYVKFLYQYINFLTTLFNNRFSHSLSDQVSISQRVASNTSFFGYYDKSSWSSLGDFFLFHQLSSNKEFLEIVVHNVKKDFSTVVGKTTTWNWQQGAMAQWTAEDNIIFNCIDENLLVSRVVDLSGNLIEKFDFPVQSLSKKGDYFISLNYLRLLKLRPDYGYDVNVQNFSQDMPYDKDGLWKINTETGSNDLILKISELIKYRFVDTMLESDHKINHAIISPNGSRILFMHRWINSSGKYSRLFSISPNGKDLKLLLDNRMISHYSWQNDESFVAWARTAEKGDRYYLINDQSKKVEIIGENILDIFGDGHPSFSPDKRWLITDTYPGRDRKQSLHLYDTKDCILYEIGRFFSPWKYWGYNRCDLHPRWSSDGLSISIDSTHEGKRGMYILDISQIILSSHG